LNVWAQRRHGPDARQTHHCRTAAGLPIEAIVQAEADGEPGTSEAAVAAFQAALERQGVIFLDANGGEGPGVRLRRLDPPDDGLRPDQLTSENDA
jgi:hypothetical protein